jgi:superfamily II DNA or RNA helicase
MEVDRDRGFTVEQKQVMAERQQFICPACEHQLSSEVNKDHGHHVYNHKLGGRTHVDNGLLLHPHCHKKMATKDIWEGCRDWQVDRLQRSMQFWRGVYVLQAVMGGGKTFFGLRFYQMRRAFIPHLLIVVPNNEVLDQTRKAAQGLGLKVRAWEPSVVKWVEGVDVYITTYPMIAAGHDKAEPGRRGPNAMRVRALIKSAGPDRVMTNLDEVHHCGDGKTWADAIELAVGESRIKLCMSGTPWRHDNNRIPFATYENGLLQADGQYTYRMALAEVDPVVEAIEFEPVTCKVLINWRHSGSQTEYNLDEYESSIKSVLGDFSTSNAWGHLTLTQAIKELDHRRANGAPDAGGIVWADNKEHADRWFAELEARGQSAVLAYSDLEDGAEALRRYKVDSSIKWLVCVKQASEGYDAPRAEVGIHANTQQTAMNFHQEFGRLIRVRKTAVRRTAKMFIPDIPTLTTLATDVERDVQVALEEREERESRPAAERELEKEFSFSVRSIGAKSTTVIFRGGEVPVEANVEVKRRLEDNGCGDIAHRSAELVSMFPQLTVVESASQGGGTAVVEDYAEVRSDCGKLQRRLMAQNSWSDLPKGERGTKINGLKKRHGIPLKGPAEMNDNQLLGWRDALKLELDR